MKKPNNRTDDHRYDDIIDLPYPHTQLETLSRQL